MCFIIETYKTIDFPVGKLMGLDVQIIKHISVYLFFSFSETIIIQLYDADLRCLEC